MADIRIDKVNSDDKPLKGLLDKGSKTFECNVCGKSLLILQLISIEGDSTSEVLTRIAVRCECGGFSCVQSVPGQFYSGAPSDLMAFDLLDDCDCAPEADILFKAWSK